MDIENLNRLIEHLICPITHQIYRNPVTLSDGITYEYEAIKEWLKSNYLSPITKKEIKLTSNVNRVILNIINQLEEQKIGETLCFDRYQNYEITILKKKFNFNHLKIAIQNKIPGRIVTMHDNLDETIIVYPENALDILIESKIVDNYLDSVALRAPVEDDHDAFNKPTGNYAIHYVCCISEVVFNQEIDYYIFTTIIERMKDSINVLNDDELLPADLAVQHNPSLIPFIVLKGGSITEYMVSQFIFKYAYPDTLKKDHSLLDILLFLLKKVERPATDVESYRHSLTLLFYACLRNSVEVIKMVTDHFPELIHIPHPNLGVYPIHFMGHEKEIVSYFIEKGANINQLTSRNETILHYQLEHRPTLFTVSYIHFFEHHGFDFNQVCNHFTVADIAFHHGDFKTAEYLLKNYLIGNEVFSKYPRKKRTKKRWKDLLTLIVEKNIDINRFNQKGNAILHLACEYIDHSGHEFISALIESGSDMNLRNHAQLLPLDILCNAFKKGYKTHRDIINTTAIVSTFIKKGACVNIDTFCSFVESGLLDAVETILKRDNVLLLHGYNSKGFPPLHMACYYQNSRMIDLLLSYGANIHQKTKYGFGIMYSLAKTVNNQETEKKKLNVCFIKKILLKFLKLGVKIYETDSIVHYFCTANSEINPHFKQMLNFVFSLHNLGHVDLNEIGLNLESYYPLHVLCKYTDDVNLILKMISLLSKEQLTIIKNHTANIDSSTLKNLILNNNYLKTHEKDTLIDLLYKME